MNSKLDRQIIDFMNTVGWYVFMEYGSNINNEYIKHWHNKDFLNNELYNLIKAYYLGGNTVPDTAHAVVQITKSKFV